jgi:hypothetical protein
LLLNPANYTSNLWEMILQMTLNPLTLWFIWIAWKSWKFLSGRRICQIISIL